jgi:hypothetical protein
MGCIIDGSAQMDQRTRTKLAELRAMTSADAADWLLENCALGSEQLGDAFLFIPKLSWRRSDQARLAEHYLSKMQFASGVPYEVFARIMPLRKLVDVIERLLPESETNKDLLRYFLAPILEKAAKSDSDREALQALLHKI